MTSENPIKITQVEAERIRTHTQDTHTAGYAVVSTGFAGLGIVLCPTEVDAYLLATLFVLNDVERDIAIRKERGEQVEQDGLEQMRQELLNAYQNDDPIQISRVLDRYFTEWGDPDYWNVEVGPALTIEESLRRLIKGKPAGWPITPDLNPEGGR